MPSKVCVFVDGENFRRSIGDLFDTFDRTDYLPKRAKWTELFDWIVEQVSNDGERVRTYWYVIEHMDFSPYKLPDADKEPEKLRQLLCKDENLKAKLQPLQGTKLVEEMKASVQTLLDNRVRMERRFNGWRTLQNAISERHSAIEFRRAGSIRCSLFDTSLGSEKAVDVKLATDLIVMREREVYDVAVIVSGDQDYVPAVQEVKDSGKKVINVAFKTRGGKLLPGGARRLNQLTDWSLQVPYKDLSRYLNIT